MPLLRTSFRIRVRAGPLFCCRQPAFSDVDEVGERGALPLSPGAGRARRELRGPTSGRASRRVCEACRTGLREPRPGTAWDVLRLDADTATERASADPFGRSGQLSCGA